MGGGEERGKGEWRRRKRHYEESEQEPSVVSEEGRREAKRRERFKRPDQIMLISDPI